MSQPGYEKFYGNPAIEVRDVSATIGPKISGFLTSNVHVATLNFPPLRRTSVGNKRYCPSDYLAVGLALGRPMPIPEATPESELMGLLKNNHTSKVGIKNKRLAAGWDNDYLAQVLFGA